MFDVRLSAAQRDHVRSIVRAHPGFEAFRVRHGSFDSRAMDKPTLMLAIETLGLESQVLAIAAAPVIQNTVGPADAASIEPVTIDAYAPITIETLNETLNAEKTETDMVASVLDPIRPFLAPTILSQIETALAPIVKAAVKPAETREVVRTVTVDEDGQPVFVSAEPPQPKHVGDSTIGKVFGLKRFKHSDKPVKLYDCADSPAIDPFYVVEPVLMAKLVTAAERGRNVWLGGPKGSGKTSLPTQYAARTKRPFVRIAFQRAIEPVDLIGQLVPEGKSGVWRWRDGLLLRSIRTPGMVILLDEITAAPPGLAMIIQTMIDHRYIDLPTGERVKCAPDVAFVSADNTFGYGDSTGLYAGTMVANGALVDRQARMLRVDYLPVELEAQALANHTCCHDDASKAACRRLVDFTAQTRKLSGLEDRPSSLRQLIAFVEQVQDGFNVKESFEDTHLTRLPDAERTTLKVFFDANFDAKAFESELLGAPLLKPAPARSDRPEQIGAQNAFETVDAN